MPKVPKAVAGYLPAQFVAREGTSCQTCRDFLPSISGCTITIPSKVSGPKGTCIIYLKGPQHFNGVPLLLVPQRVVGYIEGKEVPTSCGRCKHYEHPGKISSTCDGIGDYEEDKVEAGGCCNHYELRKGA